MHFPKLPLLEAFCTTYALSRPSLNRTVLVCVQHLLETTGSLFDQLIHLGLPPKNMYVLGKIYSTSMAVQDSLTDRGINVIRPSPVMRLGRYDEILNSDVERMWQLVLRQINLRNIQSVVVLDDGGYAVTGIPETIASALPVVGIEQTMSGLVSSRAGDSSSIPVIEVASSAAKKYIEPPMICDATFKKLARPLFEQNRKAVFGVVGLGNIGRAIALGLLRREANVLAYDKHPVQMEAIRGITRCSCLQQVFEGSDIIFGCTGTNIVEDAEWCEHLRGKKLLVSCSSQDREFASILTRLDNPDHRGALDDVRVYMGNAEMIIARGGFPANFDGSEESVPRNDIQMTRALLLGAIAQALFPVRRECLGEMLEPELQRFIVSRWIELQPRRSSWYEAGLLDRFSDLGWIEQNSGGRPRREANFAANAASSLSGC